MAHDFRGLHALRLLARKAASVRPRDALAASDLLGRAVVLLPSEVCLLIVAGGMAVGVVGSLVSLGRSRV